MLTFSRMRKPELNVYKCVLMSLNPIDGKKSVSRGMSCDSGWASSFLDAFVVLAGAMYAPQREKDLSLFSSPVKPTLYNND